jgi:methyl coenzyme M reductase subunit C
MTLRYRWTTGEPDLREVLHDDVVLAVMRRDGVSRQELNELIRRVQRQLHVAAPDTRRLPVPANDSAPRSQV